MNYDNHSPFKRLFGNNLKEVNWTSDTIKLVCEDKTYVYDAEGDCCSQTTIDSVEGPTSGKILGLVDTEPEKQDSNDGETKYYRTTLNIEGKGYLDIEYRNESNGYYGGSLEFRGEE